MPVLTKAVILFPKWGLLENKALPAIIKAELYSEFSRFDIPEEEHEACEIHEQACYARFGVIEQALRSHHIPYDVIFQLKGKEVKTRRAWRPGMHINEDREFPLLDEPMVSAKKLNELTRAYPDAVPSSLINSLISDVSYPISDLADWPEPGLSQIETDNHPEQAITGIINEHSMFEDVAALILVAKADEAQRLIGDELSAQVQYLSNVLGINTLKRKLSEAFKQRKIIPSAFDAHNKPKN